MKNSASSENPVRATPALSKPTNVRYVVLGLIAAASASAYLTRYCIGVVNTTIQSELSLSPGQMGWVLSAYGFGYLVFQIPGGWLGNRYGTRGALAGISVVWSAVTLWTASAFGFLGLFGSRVIFGLAQAGLVPISSKGVKDWFPINRRGSASATVTASMSIGGVIAMFLTAQLIHVLHWRTIFALYSLVGIVWSIVFYWYFRTDPADHAGVNAEELALIRASEGAAKPEASKKSPSDFSPNRQGTDAGSLEAEPLAADEANPYLASAADPQDESALAAEEAADADMAAGPAPGMAHVIWCMATSLSLWGICMQVFFRAAGYMVLMNWLPQILEQGYSVSKETAGMLAGIVPIGVVLGSLSGGPTIDALLHFTGSKYISRSLLCAASLTIAASISVLAAMTASPYLVITALSIGVFFWSFGNPATWVATMDIAGKDTAIVMGIMNMAGSLGGTAAPIMFGYLIEDVQKSGGNWNIMFYLIALIHFLPAVCWLVVNPNQLCTRPRK